MSITVNLPQELQEFVEKSVQSGQFQSEAEVLLGALASLKTREEFRQFQLERLRGNLREGLADVERGDVKEWDLAAFKERARIFLGSIYWRATTC